MNGEVQSRLFRGYAAPVLFVPSVPSPDVNWMRVGLSLGLCLALGIVIILLIRRLQAGYGQVRETKMHRRLKAPRRLDVLESCRLTPRATLHLIECDGQAVALTSGPDGIAVVWTQTSPTTETVP